MDKPLKNSLALLRKEKGLTQQQVADILGIKRSSYAQYETGNRQPDYSILQALADYYDCTVDYLLGRTDDRRAIVVEPKRTPEEELLKDPDIRVIARAAQKMTPEQRKDLARFLKKAFDEAFKEENK